MTYQIFIKPSYYKNRHIQGYWSIILEIFLIPKYAFEGLTFSPGFTNFLRGISWRTTGFSNALIVVSGQILGVPGIPELLRQSQAETRNTFSEIYRKKKISTYPEFHRKNSKTKDFPGRDFEILKLSTSKVIPVVWES